MIGRWLFRHDAQEASILALLIALSAVPLYGMAMITQLYGRSAEIGVSIGAIIVNAVAVHRSCRLAFVVSSTLARMQLERVIGGRDAKVFTAADEAERWLFAKVTDTAA